MFHAKKGMSVPTLCKISRVLRLSTDYILYGKGTVEESNAIALMLQSVTSTEREYAEKLLRTFLMAMDTKNDQPPAG